MSPILTKFYVAVMTERQESSGEANIEITSRLSGHPTPDMGEIVGTLGVWTLFDYGGEPGPWPLVSASFGQFDIAGFAKSAAYWYVPPTLTPRNLFLCFSVSYLRFCMHAFTTYPSLLLLTTYLRTGDESPNRSISIEVRVVFFTVFNDKPRSTC
jgi:hypothetical protein